MSGIKLSSDLGWRTLCVARLRHACPLSPATCVVRAPAVFGLALLSIVKVNGRYFSTLIVAADCGLMKTPGLIVAAMEMLFRYAPFAAAGRAFTTASISTARFAMSFSSPNDAFPMGT